MLYFANGDRFDGSWTEDRKNGPGSYYYRDGSVLMGEWKEGALEGYALICGADGSLDRDTGKRERVQKTERSYGRQAIHSTSVYRKTERFRGKELRLKKRLSHTVSESLKLVRSGQERYS